MAEAIAVRNLMTAYGVGGVPGADPTRTYLSTVMGIASAESIRDLDKEVMKTVRRQLQTAAADLNIPAAVRPAATVSTFRGLEMIIFAVQWQVRHGVAPNVILINNLITPDAVLYWKAAYRFKIDNDREGTKESDIELPVLPKGTMPNTSKFYEWWDSFVLKLDTYVSNDGFTPLGYIVRADDAPVAYADIDWAADETMQDRTKSLAIMAGDDYRADKIMLYAAVHAALADAGQSWLTRYSRQKDVRSGLVDLKNYYYGPDNEEEKIKKINRKIKGVSYHNERAGLSYEAAVGKLRELFKQLRDIGPQAELRPAVEVECLLATIKCKNPQMQMAKINVMNDRAGMAIDFEGAVNYLKNCLPADNSRSINLSAIDTTRVEKNENAISDLQAEIAALRTEGKGGKRGGGGGRMRGDYDKQAPIIAKWKDGKSLSKNEKLELCKGFSNDNFRKLPRDLKDQIRTWRTERDNGTLGSSENQKGSDDAERKKLKIQKAKLKREKLKRTIKALQKNKKKVTFESDDDSSTTSADSNDSDPASLVKNKKRKK